MCYELNGWNQMNFDAMERQKLYDLPEDHDEDYEDEYDEDEDFDA